MDKKDIIKALQIGLTEAIDLINYLYAKQPATAEIDNSIQELQQLIKYAEYAYEDLTTKKHPLYHN